MSDHKLSKFFLIVSVFITLVSVGAVYSSVRGAEISIEKDDLQSQSMTHLLNSTDWWNDYQAHKLREIIYQLELNLNPANHTISKLLTKLHADKSVTDSLANLKQKAQTERTSYDQSVATSAHYSKLIEYYDFAAILMIVAIAIGGIAEIARKGLLAYPSFIIGGIGVFVLLSVSLMSVH
jgi:Domain of unknown function (DUF4337)